jgi:predicted transcriptional regulator
MLQFFRKWSELLLPCLKNGDLRQISKETGMDYHKVRRVLDCVGKESEMEIVFGVTNALIRKRASYELSNAESFTKELLFEKQTLAEQAVEAVQRLSGNEDLVNI